jgi:two-component system sensor histidine kinase/response regulator
VPEQILIVEDDNAMSSGIRDVLEMAGYAVRMADNGRAALKILDTFKPDLIISDIMMPEMDGFEFLEQVRARIELVSIPFVFLTAKGQRTDIRVGKQLGADDYLVKSVDLEDLLVVVRAKLDRALALNQRSQVEMANLKNNILSTLSHEFRTPLTYITGYIDLMQEGTWSPDDLQRFLQRIKGGSTRLNRLIEDFLLLVRYETGDLKQTYDLDRYRFNRWKSLLERIFDNLRDLAERHTVELLSDIQPELPDIEAHEVFLESALQRLIDNAIKFSKPKGGQVTVRVAAEDNQVCVHIIDQGIGIRAAELPKLFERFHQIDRAKMEQQGAGIGLAIVKGFVDLHHASIVCHSQEGVGSEFVVCFPVLK